MKAVIMAGGGGTRLRPLTCNTPKPMVDILDRPVMEYTIERLKKYGITDIIVTLHYLPNEIKDYFSDGSDFGVNLTYFVEDEPLGTAGSVKNAEAELTEPFFVISGDAVTDIDLNAVKQYHEARGSIATLVLKKEESPLEYGVVVTDEEGRITRFIEKPAWSEVFSDLVNTGIYLLDPQVFTYFEKGEFFDFSKDLFPKLLSDQKPLFGYQANGYWCDIGDLETYRTCQFDLMDQKTQIELKNGAMTPGIYIGKNAKIEKGAVIQQPVYLGDNVTVKNGAIVGPYTVLGSDTTVQNYASVKKSIILSGSHIGRCAEIRGAVIGHGCAIKDGVSIFEGAVIGDGCVIHTQAKIQPQVKVWPKKNVEGAAIVSENLIWGSYHTRPLFSEANVDGEINVDITPEYASKLGTIFGALHRGKTVGIATDGKASSKMLGASLAAGIQAAGAGVTNYHTQVLPALRFGVPFFGQSGGVYIKSGQTSYCLTLLDEHGAQLPRDIRRKLEANFARDNVSRCEPEEIGDITEYTGLSSVYERQCIHQQTRKDTGIDLMFECPAGSSTDLLKSVFEAMGCGVSFGNVYSKPVSSIGVIWNDALESIALIDEDDRRVDDEKMELLRYLLLLKNEMTQNLIVPVSASGAVDEMADQYKVMVTRTKTGCGELQAAMNKAAETRQFRMAVDPVYFLSVLLDTLARNHQSLRDLLQEIPFYYKSTSFVDCGFGEKGEIIKKLVKNHETDQTELTEGIKIFLDKGWTLIVPDNDLPVFKVISEGYSEEYAKELSAGCAKEIGSLLQK